MLELKNITKVYKTKAQEVKALDNLSLYFEETGMVFITGKSGSGKTTLLNVIGGLDDFDQGELIIKDKSTKSFTKSDYDSYRNTYIGFVFQEYNLLDSLTIEQNLALATELQGKQKDDEQISEILKKVDIYDVLKRKPQELSGGQRQRVAIARALIKNPSIIMADEPTGALDSVNGLQVMDVLKKLSKEKLVIIVSHDLDLADKYADRIINLVDGKVESDITLEVNEKARKKVAKGKDQLLIKRNAKLSPKDLDTIKTAVAEGKDLQITDDIGKKRKKTKKQIHKEYSNTEFIKTRMSFLATLRMGGGALKTKVIRLVITILLCAISFSVFGVFDSMAIYDEHRLAVNTLSASIAPSITFTSKIIEENGRDYSINVNQALIDEIEKQSHYTINGVYSSYYMGAATPTELRDNQAAKISKYYFYKAISGAVEFDEEELEKHDFEMLYGRLPSEQEGEGYDEIAISEYYANCLINWGYKYTNDEEEEVYPSSIAELVNEEKPLTLELGTSSTKTSYKIVGIVKTGTINIKFNKLLGRPEDEVDKFDEASQLDQNEFKNYIQNGYFLYVFTRPGFAEHALQTYNTATEYKNTGYRFKFAVDTPFSVTSTAGEETTTVTGESVEKEIPRFFLFDDLKNLDEAHVFFDPAKTSLGLNEVLIDVTQYTTFYKDLVNIVLNDAREYAQLGQEYALAPEQHPVNPYTNYLTVNSHLETISTDNQVLTNKGASAEEKIDAIKDLLVNNDSDSPSVYHELIKLIYTDHDKTTPTLTDIFNRSLTLTKLDPTKYASVSGDFATLQTVPVKNNKFKIVGFYAGVSDATSSCFMVSEETLDNLGIDKNQGCFSKLIATNLGGGNINKLSSLLYSSQGLTFETVNLAFSMIKANPDFFQNLSLIFLIGSAIFAFFSIIMFSNFISTSIRDKYSEIGILRALGAKGSDILKIFIIESIIIALINAVAATVIAAIGSLMVNIFLCNYLNLFIPLSTFGIRQCLIIFALSLAVGIISATIPIVKVSKQKPVETIRRAFD